LGGFLGFLGLVIVVVASAFIQILLFGTSEYEAEYTTQELVILTIDCIIICLWSGYIISTISKKAKISTPIIASIIVMVFAFFPVREVPIWYMLSSALLAPPLFYFGAKFHVTRLTKRLSAGTQQSCAP